ncbi:MAG: isochorismatase family protein [Duganella sp.]
MKNALIVIDVQNDYFAAGGFTLENADVACRGAAEAIAQAKRDGWLVVGVQHINAPGAPAFLADTEGVKIHPSIADALGDAQIILKKEADSFFETELEAILRDNGVTDIYLTGMMTQHCVTHTALSPQANGMNVNIIANGCAAPSQALSDLALTGLAARCTIV